MVSLGAGYIRFAPELSGYTGHFSWRWQQDCGRSAFVSLLSACQPHSVLCGNLGSNGQGIARPVCRAWDSSRVLSEEVISSTASALRCLIPQVSWVPTQLSNRTHFNLQPPYVTCFHRVSSDMALTCIDLLRLQQLVQRRFGSCADCSLEKALRLLRHRLSTTVAIVCGE